MRNLARCPRRIAAGAVYTAREYGQMSTGERAPNTRLRVANTDVVGPPGPTRGTGPGSGGDDMGDPRGGVIVGGGHAGDRVALSTSVPAIKSWSPCSRAVKPAMKKPNARG